MLKVKINNKWVDGVISIFWNNKLQHWAIETEESVFFGQIQDIKWGSDEPEEIEEESFKPRLKTLENKVQALTDAVVTLAGGVKK